MYKLLQSKKRGSALPLAVLAVLLLLTMGMGLLSLGLSARILSIRNASDIAAQCAADAGLTKALFETNQMLKSQSLDDDNLPESINELFIVTQSLMIPTRVILSYLRVLAAGTQELFTPL